MQTLQMTNAFTFYFRGTDIIKLADQITHDREGYVLVNCGLEVATLPSGKDVAVMAVMATAFTKTAGSAENARATMSVDGCPVPPCVPTDGKIGKGCEKAIKSLLSTYEDEEYKKTLNLE